MANHANIVRFVGPGSIAYHTALEAQRLAERHGVTIEPDGRGAITISGTPIQVEAARRAMDLAKIPIATPGNRQR